MKFKKKKKKKKSKKIKKLSKLDFCRKYNNKIRNWKWNKF